MRDDVGNMPTGIITWKQEMDARDRVKQNS
jgi:hypothetical protein